MAERIKQPRLTIGEVAGGTGMEMKERRTVTEEALQEGSRPRLTKLVIARDGALRVEGEPHPVVCEELWVATPGSRDVLLVTRDGWLTLEGVRRALCTALGRTWLCSKTTRRRLPKFGGRVRTNRNRNEFQPSEIAAFLREQTREIRKRRQSKVRRQLEVRRKLRAQGPIFNLTDDDLISVESPLQTRDRFRRRKQRLDARRTEVCLASAVLAAQVFRRALTHSDRVCDDQLAEAKADLTLAQAWLDSLPVPL